MKTKLGVVVVLVEIASVAGVLFLRGQRGLPAPATVLLVFSLPMAFGLHVCEEFIFPGGAGDWFKAYRPQYADAYTPSYFLRINVLPLVAAVLVCLGAFDYRGGFSFAGIRAWLAFVSLQGFNGLYHLRGTLESRRYSPGLLTGILLYLPLTLVAFASLLRSGAVDFISAAACLLFGLGSQRMFDLLKERRLQRAAPRAG